MIEDNENDSRLFEMVLMRFGIGNEFRIAVTAESALNFLHNNPLLPDLVLIDLNLPGMDGVQIIETLRSNDRFRFLPIAVLSGSDHRRLEALTAGANAFIEKPLTFDGIFEIARQLGLKWYLRNPGGSTWTSFAP